jgi:RNA polymerase sporulation-specific sigma factor
LDCLELFEKNKKLVYYLVNKYHVKANCPSYWELEDLYQEGFLGLWKAARTYKPEKGYAFSTYAIKCISNQVLMYLRKYKKRLPDNAISLDEMVSHKQKDDTDILYHEVIGKEGNVDSELLAHELVNFYENEKNTTSLYERDPSQRERHKQLFELVLEGHNQRYIGEKLGITQPYASRLIKKMKKQIHQCWYEGEKQL